MQKITLTNIKTYIIHKLGGKVKEDFKCGYICEHEDVCNISFNHGYKVGLLNGQKLYRNNLVEYVKSIYGSDKQEWIDNVCGYISKKVEDA